MFCDAHALIVPSASFKIDSTDECSVFGHLYFKATIGRCVHAENLCLVVRRVFIVDESELELERIDLDLILSSVVLQDGRQETLREEEAR